jgi:glycine cleavage system H protein
VQPGDALQLGQVIGWIEGFKALTELYSVVSGEFLGGNPALEQDVTLVDSDPYGKGWLYRMRGEADPASTDVEGYRAALDSTIDRMVGKAEAAGQPVPDAEDDGADE